MTMNPFVVHKRQPHDVYIGRPSIFGNPFVIGVDGTRRQVIEKYRAYALSRMKADLEFAEAVRSLRGKTLGCFCAPLPCHGDILAEIANQSENTIVRFFD